MGGIRFVLAYRACPNAGGASKGVTAMDMILAFLNAVAAIATAFAACVDVIARIVDWLERE